MHPDPGRDVVHQADLDDLNRRAALRTVDLARRASWVILGVAGLLVLSWLWNTLRSQGVLSHDDEGTFSPIFIGEHLSARQRIDFFAVTLSTLGTAVLVAAAGIGVRIYCDVATLRIGGSLTGWELGDPIDED